MQRALRPRAISRLKLDVSHVRKLVRDQGSALGKGPLKVVAVEIAVNGETAGTCHKVEALSGQVKLRVCNNGNQDGGQAK